MKTRKEVLEEFAKNGDCENINCKKECPYCFSDKCLDLDLRKIGAMAILRMFKEKKKPTFTVGTKIKFSDGKIAVIDTYNKRDHFLMLDGVEFRLDYLIGRTWEIVE